MKWVYVLIAAFVAVAFRTLVVPALLSPAQQNLTIASGADLVIAAIYDTAASAMKENEFDSVLEMLGPVINGDYYNDLSSGRKLAVDELYGLAAGRLGYAEAAHEAYARAVTNPQAGRDDWYYLFQFSKLDNDFEDTYRAFNALKLQWQDLGRSLSDLDVSIAEQGFGTLPDATAKQLEFETYLENTNWQPINPAFSRAVIWRNYATNLYETGNQIRAYEIANRIDDPFILSGMKADKRFDRLASDNPERFDIGQASDAILQRFMQMVNNDPGAINAQVGRASKLYEAGLFDEALVIVDSALNTASQMTFEQRQRYYNFDADYDSALALKASLLFGLGNYEKALGIASTIGAGGRTSGPKPGATLLSAQFLVALDRGQEALSHLNTILDETQTFPHQGQWAMLRACAAVQTHDAQLYQRAIEKLDQTQTYGPIWLLTALLCGNDIAGAEQIVERDLSNTRTRALMLEALQIYRPEKAPTRRQKELTSRFDALRARYDVQLAVARVGRINEYPIVFLGPSY